MIQPADRLLRQYARKVRGFRRVRRPETSDTPAFQLSYVRTGPRGSTPVVVIPGGPGLGSILPFGIIRKLARSGGMDLIMVEHRGVGLSRYALDGSPLPERSMWIRNVLDDLRAVLDHEGVTRAHIVGSSYGSYLASSFAARYPDRVAGMILDSALQSAQHLPIERTAIRSLFLDADTQVAQMTRSLISDGADQRILLDVIRAAYELGGDRLLAPLLERRIAARRDPVWSVLESFAVRDASITRIPGGYEFDIVGAIGFRELGYGGEPDGLPLDPALTYAPLSGVFPAFDHEPYDLMREIPDFSWPLVLLIGDRDLRTPPPIAQHVAEIAQDSTVVHLHNGHSALDTHPVALMNAARFLVRGEQGLLAARSEQIDQTPIRGLVPRVPGWLQAAITIDTELSRVVTRVLKRG